LLVSPYFYGNTDPVLSGINLRWANAEYDPEKIRAIYNMATLFWMIEGIDLEKAKASLTNYAYLDYMKGRSFQISASRMSFSNQFGISLPSTVTYDAANSAYPMSISWSWAPVTGVGGNPITLGITGNPITTPAFLPTSPALVSGFSIDTTTGKGGSLTATVNYANASWKQSSIDLVYLPQHTQVTLSLPTSGLDTSGNTVTVLIDGDTPKSAILNRRKTSSVATVSKDITSQLTAGVAGTYSLTLGPTNFAGTGSFDFQITIDGVSSPWITTLVKNANDTDGNGLPDAWEILYFERIGVDPKADPDIDGKTNMTENLLGTNPLISGPAEVIKEAHFAPYTQPDGTVVNKFHPYGDLYANLYLDGGTLDLQGRTLIVEGNLIQSGGSYLYINGGKLIVMGDYRQQVKNADGTYGTTTGQLNMTNALDSVVVNGQFVTQTSSINSLTAGVLEVKGDFTQKNGGTTTNNFSASTTHKVLLSGANLQTVSFESPGAPGGNAPSTFNSLEITNNSSAGVTFATPIAIQISFLSSAKVLSGLTVNGKNWMPTADQTIAGDLQLAGGQLNLNGKTLTVEGNLIQSGGQLSVNGGKLIVQKDYRIQSMATAADGSVIYGVGTGQLAMTNALDSVVVHGQFVTQGAGSFGSSLTAGVLEVKGDFTQKEGSGSYGRNVFNTTGTHKVLLSGLTKQTVSFESSAKTWLNSTWQYSGFNILEIANASADSVVFATAYFVAIDKVPGAPTGVAATAADASAIVSFSAPAQNGGSLITGFKVTSSAGNLSANGAVSPITIAGLVNGTAYSFVVTATNAAGTSIASIESNFVTPIAVSTINFPIVLAPGWNLIGNSLNQTMPVATLYGDATVVTTVWKWDVIAPGWQFYSPQMDAATLSNYATGKGYGVLNTINPGEGYWVNAKVPATLIAQTGAPFVLTAANLVTGWNLTATSVNVMPAAFNLSLSTTPPAPGIVPINFTSLWAWDNLLSQWYFYAPSLEANGGLVNYITGKGYLDFTQGGKTLGVGTGFWVNRP
jgi:hypothetical protein